MIIPFNNIDGVGVGVRYCDDSGRTIGLFRSQSAGANHRVGSVWWRSHGATHTAPSRNVRTRPTVPAVALQSAIADAGLDMRGTRVVVRSGSTWNIADLRKISAATAKVREH